MRRLTILLAALAVVLYLGGLPAVAQHGQGQQERPAKPQGGPRKPGKPTKPDRPTTPAGEKGTKTQAGKEASQKGSKKTVGDLVAQNTKLASKLQRLLPAGTDLQAAASRFKNLGQFVAAVHVSHNLGIPLDQLKTKILAGKSLGEAIQELKPNVAAEAEAKKAKKQAKRDMEETGS